MLRLPHIRQSRPPGSLLAPLHNLNSFHIWAVDFIPHLDAHSGEFIAQKYSRIDAPAPDVDAHSGKWIAVLETHQQHVAYFGSFGVGAAEELGARPGGVEEGDLRGVKVGEGVLEAGGWGGRRWEGFYFLVDWRVF